MKRLNLFSFSIVLITVLLSNSAFSSGPNYRIINENDPCTGYWPEIEWNCHLYLLKEVESCPDCHIIIEFCHRETYLGRGEYQITGIYGNDPCLLCSESDIYQEAYAEILLIDPFGTAHDNQSHIVQQAACLDIDENNDPVLNFIVKLPGDDLLNPSDLNNYIYSIDSLGNYNIEVDFGFLPCGDVCCHMQYFIEHDPETGEIIKITHNMEGVSEWPDCDENPECEPNCDVLEFDWPFNSGKKPMINIATINSDNNVKICPNPNAGKFKITIRNNGSFLDKIIFFNIYGHIIYQHNIENNSLSFEAELNITNIINGVIFYKLYAEHGSVMTGKLIITK